MPSLSWGAPAGTVRQRLLRVSAATAALLALLVFAANAHALAPATVKIAAVPRTGRVDDRDAVQQQNQAAPTEEASQEGQAPLTEEAKGEGQAPPAEEAPQENKTPPDEEAPKEHEAPPAEEPAHEQEAPPGEETPHEGEAPPAEEPPHEHEGPPAEETPQEQQAPPVEEAPRQEQEGPPVQQGAEEDPGGPAEGGEQGARGAGQASEGEQEPARDTARTGSEAGEETARHGSGSEEAQRAGATEEGAEAASRPIAPVEGAEAPGDQQDTIVEAQAGQPDVPSDVVSGAGPSARGVGVHAAAIGEFAEETAARLTGELSCELSALGAGGDGCGEGWPGDRAGLGSLGGTDVATAISSIMAAQAGAPARAGHGDSSLGSVPVAPAPGLVPGGSSGAAAGASGGAPSPALTQAGILLSGAPCAMHTLRLSSKPWLTTYYALIPERPG